jgi:hypothetical protein
MSLAEDAPGVTGTMIGVSAVGDGAIGTCEGRLLGVGRFSKAFPEAYGDV